MMNAECGTWNAERVYLGARQCGIRICFFIVVMLAVANASDVGSKNRAANRLYNRGEYEEALRLYDEALAIDPTDGKLKMNRGSALYRLGEFEEAEKSYIDALSSLREGNKNTNADAHYNLGNVQFRLGEQLEESGNMSGARAKYSQALENYISTLKLRPSDRDAKWNLQMAHQKIDMLQNEEDQPQSQDGEGDDNQEQNQNQNQEQNQNDDDGQDDKNDNGENNDEQQEQEQEQEIPRNPEQEMKQEEAARLIEQFADDDENLNKPPQRQGRVRQPEKNW